MAIGLAVTCTLSGALWSWQGWKYSGLLEIEEQRFERDHAGQERHPPFDPLVDLPYRFGGRGTTPFLRGMNDFLMGQIPHGGQISFHHFAFLLLSAFEGEGRDEIHRLESHVLIPLENWVDIVARDTTRGRVVFRISRCEGVDSGWYVFQGDRCVVHVPVDTSAVCSIGQVKDARQRADLKRYSWRAPNESRAVVEETFQSQWIDVALDMSGNTFEAWANGQSLGTLDLTAFVDPNHPGLTADQPSLEFLAEGFCGIRAADRPAVRVDRIRIDGLDASGDPMTIEETFDPPSRSVSKWALIILQSTAGFLGASLAALIALALLLPGVGVFAIMRWLIITTVLVNLISLWDEARHLINFIYDLEGHRFLQRALWVMLCALLVLRRRRHFRFRIDTLRKGTLRAWQALLWALVVTAALVMATISFVQLHWPIPEPWIYRGVETWLGVQEWSGEESLFVPIVEPDRAAVTLDLSFELTLNSPDSVFEIYFNQWLEPPAMIPHWEAIRLTPRGIGFVESEGFNPPVKPMGLEVGEAHTIAVRIENGEITLTAHRGDLGDGPVVAEVKRDWDWRGAGGVGLVARSGNGELRMLGGSYGELTRDAIVGRSLNAQVYQKPVWFLILVISFAALVGFGFALLASIAGHAPARLCLKWGAVTALAALALGGWRLGVQFVAPRGLAEWLAGNIFTFSLMGATVMWLVFWICNGRALRWFTLGVVLLSIAVLAELELCARQSPLREFWQVRTRTGYIFRDFLFADHGASLIWGDYTRMVDYNGEECPIPLPEGGERRIFCIGGSSTAGAGVDRPDETYPSLLETELALRSDDPRWNVFNAGHPSFTINDDLLRWRRDIRMRHPEAIVICAGGNDNIALAGSTTRQREVMELVRWLNEPSLGSIIMQRVYALRLLVGARTAIDGLRGNEVARYQVNTPPEDFEASLRTIIEEALEDGVHVVLAPEVVVEALTRDDHELFAYHEVMRRLAAEYGLTLVDTVGAMRQHPLDTLMVDHIHPNRLGNEILASAIADAILSSD